MGEILGIGATHYPPGLVPDEYKPWPLVRMLQGDRIPDHMKNPANWPEPMRLEWGDDDGITAHKTHRAQIFDAFRRIRQEIDAFKPDVILIWGDDQYENFREDIIPPFCVLAYDDFHFQPFHRLGERPNIWGEPHDQMFKAAGHREAGRYLTSGLLEAGVDMAYAYQPLHGDGLGHAFANTLLFLDLDRKGFNYPVLPVAVNCYGRNVIRMRGGAGVHVDEPDPPSPSPRRCFEVGQATARVLKDSPWRIVLMASSSWSHAFLTEKNSWAYPDLEADRALLEHLKSGDYLKWKDITLDDVEQSGQQEVLNWFCLVGAMSELGRQMDLLAWAETWTFNAPKCMALFK
ncbi:MAG: extradiol ring-cleavage dioxygenase [Candidatus Tectomicrobia bacterium]|nr:extradiol ring-cleavage dioxygenase [Candidatus Tectomicrobia bacterium]